jgi:hypothetical protein
VAGARDLDLEKAPGMAETIDWVAALAALGVTELSRPDIVRTLGAIVKTPDDLEVVGSSLGDLGYAETTSS